MWLDFTACLLLHLFTCYFFSISVLMCLKAINTAIKKIFSRKSTNLVLFYKWIMYSGLNAQPFPPHLNHKILTLSQRDTIIGRLDIIDISLLLCLTSRYNGLVTGQRAKGIIALCWILSVGIGLTPMLGWNRGGIFVLSNINVLLNYIIKR